MWNWNVCLCGTGVSVWNWGVCPYGTGAQALQNCPIPMHLKEHTHDTHVPDGPHPWYPCTWQNTPFAIWGCLKGMLWSSADELGTTAQFISIKIWVVSKHVNKEGKKALNAARGTTWKTKVFRLTEIVLLTLAGSFSRAASKTCTAVWYTLNGGAGSSDGSMSGTESSAKRGCHLVSLDGGISRDGFSSDRKFCTNTHTIHTRVCSQLWDQSIRKSQLCQVKIPHTIHTSKILNNVLSVPLHEKWTSNKRKKNVQFQMTQIQHYMRNWYY